MKYFALKHLFPPGRRVHFSFSVWCLLCLLICGSTQQLTSAQGVSGQEARGTQQTTDDPGAVSDEQLRAQADQFRAAKKWKPAIAIYREIVRRHPEYYEDRVWIARLTAWNGEFADAARLLKELLRENPREYDTRVLMADVQSWMGNYDVALRELETLNQEYPRNTEILLRLGRVNRWHRKKEAAREYLQQTLAVDERNTEAQEELNSLKAEMNWEMHVTYAGEANSFAPNSHIASVSIARIAEGRTTWNAEAAISRRFGLTDVRFGGEINRRLRPGSVLRGSAFFSPTARVVAQQAYSTAFVQKLGNRSALDAGYVFLRFRNAQVHHLAPRLDFYLRQNLWVTGSYGYSFTTYKNPRGSIGNQSAALSVSYQRTLSDLFTLSYSWGREPFGPSTIDRIGTFRANTWGASWRHFVSPRWGFVTGYSWQKRSGGGTQQHFSFGVIKRW